MRRGPHPAPTGASAKRSSLCGASKVAKVGSGRGSNLLKSDRRRRLAKRSSPPQKGLRSAGGPKLLKWGLSERGSNLLKSDHPLRSTTPGCHEYTQAHMSQDVESRDSRLNRPLRLHFFGTRDDLPFFVKSFSSFCPGIQGQYSRRLKG